MRLSKLWPLIILFMFYGCSAESPKTENPLLNNKKISWSNNRAEYYEFLSDGSLLACGGDFPVEGYVAGEWESKGENGDFKIVEGNTGSTVYLLASLETTIAKGSKLLLEYFKDEGENRAALKNIQTQVTIYEEITSSHGQSAISSEATVIVTRFKNNIFVLELMVDDLNGIIKKVLTEGDAITTEVMVTNGKKWVNNPPILLSKHWDGVKPVYSKMTVLYHDGRKETATFQTTGYVDKSDRVFEDAWF